MKITEEEKVRREELDRRLDERLRDLSHTRIRFDKLELLYKQFVSRMREHLEVVSDVIYYDTFIAIEVNSPKGLTIARRELKEFFGRWVDKLTYISAPFSRGLKELKEKDGEVLLKYRFKEPTKGGVQDMLDYHLNQGLVQLWMIVPYSRVPKSILKEGKCDFVEENHTSLSFVCKK